jgi:nucleotide-binding universal stress UspA family protein
MAKGWLWRIFAVGIALAVMAFGPVCLYYVVGATPVWAVLSTVVVAVAACVVMFEPFQAQLEESYEAFQAQLEENREAFGRHFQDTLTAIARDGEETRRMIRGYPG